MKALFPPARRRFGPALLLLLATPALVFAAGLGRATADFSNLKPNRNETPFGRMVADALQNAGGADAALVNAGALRAGTLEAGEVENSDIEALLSFSDDAVATLSLSGAQIRAALERGAGAFPTGSPAFLHVAGLSARFDASSPSGKRIKSIKIRGKNLDDGASYSVAMPISLAEGAAGYFNIWNGAQKRESGQNLIGAIANHFKARGDLAPDGNARFGPA